MKGAKPGLQLQGLHPRMRQERAQVGACCPEGRLSLGQQCHGLGSAQCRGKSSRWAGGETNLQLPVRRPKGWAEPEEPSSSDIGQLRTRGEQRDREPLPLHTCGCATLRVWAEERPPLCSQGHRPTGQQGPSPGKAKVTHLCQLGRAIEGHSSTGRTPCRAVVTRSLQSTEKSSQKGRTAQQSRSSCRHGPQEQNRDSTGNSECCYWVAHRMMAETEAPCRVQCLDTRTRTDRAQPRDAAAGGQAAGRRGA